MTWAIEWCLMMGGLFAWAGFLDYLSWKDERERRRQWEERRKQLGLDDWPSRDKDRGR